MRVGIQIPEMDFQAQARTVGAEDDEMELMLRGALLAQRKDEIFQAAFRAAQTLRESEPAGSC